MADVSAFLRNWRLANSIKQGHLAKILGVSQAAVSRWENGIDQPSAEVLAKIRSLVDKQAVVAHAIDKRIIERQPGLRALVELDGMRLLATTPTFKSMWPEMMAAEGQWLGDHLTDLSRELFNDRSIMKAIRRGEIAMITAVSDRHLIGFGDRSFRHYWTATYRTIGVKHYAEISFEACQQDAEVGIRHVLRVDEI